MDTKYAYMAVTPDYLELPIIVEDSVPKLAQKLGLSKSSVYTSIKRNRSGKNQGFKLIKVKI